MPAVITALASCLGAMPPCAAHEAVTVPISIVRNAPVLDISVGGRSFQAVFDLGGSDALILPADAVASLDLEILAEPYVWLDVMGNRLEGRRFHVPELQIGSLVLNNVTGHEDAEAATYRKSGPPIAYLGNELINSVRLVIDYPHARMTFIPNEIADPAAHGCHGTEVPMEAGIGGSPVTRVSTDLGESLFVWDTGAPVSIFREELVDQNRRPVTDKFITTSRFVVAGNDFGPLPLRLLKFAEPSEVDGFVGHTFFEKHIVCIDLAGRRLFVRAPP